MPPSVAWVTSDWHDINGPGGCCWYRCLLPARALHKYAGWRTGVFRHLMVDDDGRLHPFNEDGKIHPDGWDLVIFQRWTDEVAPDTIANAVRAGQLVGNDLDDWMHGMRSTNPGWQALKKNPGEMRGFKESIGRGAFLICSTNYLAGQMRTKFRTGPVVVAHNMIDLERWPRRAPQWPPKTVGWVGSTSYHEGDFGPLRGVLDHLCKRYGMTVVHGGKQPWERSLAEIGGITVDVEERLPIQVWRDYPSLFDGIDLAVVPLEDMPFNRAKSWCKLSEFSASGIPAIASDLEPYRDWGHPYRAGRPRDWLRQLERMIQDRSVWEHARETQLKRVAGIDVAVAWEEWAGTLEHLCAYLGHVPLSGGQMHDQEFVVPQGV